MYNTILNINKNLLKIKINVMLITNESNVILQNMWIKDDPFYLQ